jgi:ABC-type antimicrobial peptide transport system permease subunit
VVPEIFAPHAQLSFGSMDVVVRTKVPPLSLATAVEAAVHALDREIPVARVRSLKDVVATSIALPRFYTTLLAIFATVAVALASLGIFGVISYAVVQRSREIGIRLALGARPSGVLAMILRQATALAVAGVALGLVGAVALRGTISGLLFQLSPTDPSTLGAVAAILTLVALIAGYIPARQATRVDPIVTLRGEQRERRAGPLGSGA